MKALTKVSSPLYTSTVEISTTTRSPRCHFTRRPSMHAIETIPERVYMAPAIVLNHGCAITGQPCYEHTRKDNACLITQTVLKSLSFLSEDLLNFQVILVEPVLVVLVERLERERISNYATHLQCHW